MRKILIMILVCLTFMEVSAQRVTANFHNTSMTEALLTIERQCKDVRINFIYNELEDFTVTQSIRNKPVYEALQSIVGFYPIRVSRNGKIYSLECVQKEAAKVKGRILDEKNNPMAFANVTLLSVADSSYINGGVSNDNGDIVIPCGQKEVLARVSFIGYKTQLCRCSNGNLGTIKMKVDNIKLSNVKVKGVLPIVSTDKGKITYNMPLLLEQMPADNAYDALSKIPGLYDNDGSINYGGQEATLIINGKPTTLSMQQIVEKLKNMPAMQLQKAEIMMSAPSRYHVRGLAINVVTKDFTDTNQISAQIEGIGEYSKYWAGKGKANVLINSGKLTLSANYSLRKGSEYVKMEYDAYHNIQNENIHYNEVSENRKDLIQHKYGIGLDYAISEDSKLSVNYNGEWESDDDKYVSVGSCASVLDSKLHYYIHNADINYSLPFGLDLSLSYLGYQNPRSQQLDGEAYQTHRDLITDSKQNINKWLFSADQVHELNNDWELSYGMMMQFTDNRSYQTTTDLYGTPLPDATSSVDYLERIYSPYVGISKQFGKKLSLDASVTVENYNSLRWNEWRVYPSLNAMWNINKDNMLNLSFNSNAKYPSYWSTMSSIYYMSLYSELWGNPELKSASIYKLNLMWRHKQRYSVSLFADIKVDNAMQQAYQPSDRVAVIFKSINFNYRDMLGVMASAHLISGKRFSGSVSATGYYLMDKADNFFDLQIDRTKMSFILSGNASWLISERPNLRFNITPFFMNDFIQGLYDADNKLSIDASLRWTSDNGRWVAELAGDNITNSCFCLNSRLGGQNFSMRMWQSYQTYSLNVIYKIGNYKARKAKAIDTSRMGY